MDFYFVLCVSGLAFSDTKVDSVLCGTYNSPVVVRPGSADQMVFREHTKSLRYRSLLGRSLVLMLLLGIIYASTFGSIHSHEDAGTITVNSGTGVDLTANRLNSRAPLQDLSHGRVCLICLLHQQLFNTIIPGPVNFDRLTSLAGSFSPETVSYSSIASSNSPFARLPGRAPPRS